MRLKLNVLKIEHLVKGKVDKNKEAKQKAYELGEKLVG